MTAKMPLSLPARRKMSFSERAAWLYENRFINVPHISKDVEHAFYRREMEMDCPDCGLRQPAGNYCWRCACPTFTPEWFNKRDKYKLERTATDIARDEASAARLRAIRSRRKPARA